jgi:hypothetical protein
MQQTTRRWWLRLIGAIVIGMGVVVFMAKRIDVHKEMSECVSSMMAVYHWAGFRRVGPALCEYEGSAVRR